MFLLDIFKSIISGIQFDYKRNNQSAIIVPKMLKSLKTNVLSLYSKRHLQSISLFTESWIKC